MDGTPSTGADLTSDLDAAEAALRAELRGYGSVCVCLSGGVDSSLLAALAREELDESVLAVTGVSASLASAELDDARAFCESRGIAHEAVVTEELQVPGYVENSPDRCFHCKTELYGRVTEIARARGVAVVVDGTHAQDLDGHRPGHRAATDHAVRSPLLELGIGKETIRGLARRLGLQNADRPSAPCLSSRIAYGLEVTPERLGMVERAESAIRALGFEKLRVRHHDGVARIEVPRRELAAVVERAAEIQDVVKAAGFTWVTLDLGGLRSGSLLEILPAPASKSPA